MYIDNHKCGLYNTNMNRPQMRTNIKRIDMLENTSFGEVQGFQILLYYNPTSYETTHTIE